VSEAAVRWAEWRRDHTAALAALQDAQRAYHRAIVGANRLRPPVSGQPPLRQQALDVLDAARAKLDDVRARMPR
jgi:hypothetical protein